MPERVKNVEREKVKTMENKHFSELMATLECLELTAADVLDTVATAKAELKQTFEKTEQMYKRASA